MIQRAGHTNMTVNRADRMGRIEGDPAQPLHMGLRPDMQGLRAHGLLAQQIAADAAGGRPAPARAGDEQMREAGGVALGRCEGLHGVHLGAFGVKGDRLVAGVHQVVQLLQWLLRNSDGLAGEGAHAFARMGELGGAQIELDGEGFARAAHHASHVDGLDLALDQHLEMLDGAFRGEGVGDVAEGVFARRQMAVHIHIDAPGRHMLGLEGARGQAQGLQHGLLGCLEMKQGLMVDLDAHARLSREDIARRWLRRWNCCPR